MALTLRANLRSPPAEQTRGANVSRPQVGPTCRAHLWNRIVELTCGANDAKLWSPPVEPTCGANLLGQPVEPICGSNLWSQLVGLTCGANLWG